MTSQLVAHRIQLLPNNAAREHFRKAAGIARFTWNWALAEWERQYQEGGKPNALQLKKQFIALIDQEWPWMREVSTYVVQQPFLDLSAAYKRFFKKLGGPPKFKKKGRARDSFYLANTAFRINGHHVTVSRLGVVRMAEELRYQGKIMSARINREADRWYLSVCVEADMADPPAINPRPSVGVELGIRKLAVLSTKEVVENPRPLQSNLKQLARAQRKLARQENGSNRRQRQKIKIAKLHQRIGHVRENTLHQLTADLTKRFGQISIREQNVKDMMQDPRFARGLSDVAMHEFRRQLTYKGQRQGVEIVIADRLTPTSKQCSHCGHINESLTLAQIVWQCPACQVWHDREDNAARNLLELGKTTRRARESDARGLDGSVSEAQAEDATSQVETRTRLGKLTPTRKPASGGPTATT